jgi:hypothetical protein
MLMRLLDSRICLYREVAAQTEEQFDSSKQSAKLAQVSIDAKEE